MATQDKPKYVVLKNKKTGTVEDICEIGFISTGNMGQFDYLMHRINARLNPFYTGEVSYESVVLGDEFGEGYDLRIAKKCYDLVRISAEELPSYVNCFTAKIN
ncbi:MAG: hypothetical protein WCI72_01410 [archaeon]